MTVVAKWTGVPLQRMEEKETEKLLKMEDELKSRVIGQDEAVAAISRALRRSRADLKDPRRPIGSFIFLGPTGVGKTYLARNLAEFMFGDRRRSSRSTCPSTWRNSRAAASLALLRDMSVTRRADSSPRQCVVAPIRSFFSTKSKKPTLT
jgi:DNA polymerase III delta prime subunit